MGGTLEEPTKILIVQCPDAQRWYADLVGELVPHLATEATEYKSLEPAGYVNFVLKEDGEVVSGRTKN